MPKKYLPVRLLLASIVIFSLQSNCLATPLDITFGSADTPTGLYPQLNIIESGISLSITSSTSTAVPSQIFLDSSGLGIRLLDGSDGNELDNLGPDESLVLRFSEDVTLLNATFSQLGTNDDFIISSLSNVYASNFTNGNINDTGSQQVMLTNLSGNEFIFSALGTYSEYSLKALSFEKFMVDAPPALALFLGGFLFVYQRKRQLA